MKKQPDYLATICWYGEAMTGPYQVIAAFFDHGDIAYYRKLIKGMLLHVNSHKIYFRHAPGDLLFESKMLESLIRAADVLSKAKTKKHGTIPEEDLLNKKWYCGRHSTCSGWDELPRALSKKEYMTPYRVFDKFFAYQGMDKWIDDLQEILTYALLKNTEPVEMDLLAVYFHLAKLVEAAHLIAVRRDDK